MNKLLLFLSPFVIAAAVLLGTAAPASAASVYDDQIEIATALAVTRDSLSVSYDVTTTYMTPIMEQCSQDRTDIIQDSLDSGNWFIKQLTYSNQKHVVLYFTTSGGEVTYNTGDDRFYYFKSPAGNATNTTVVTLTAHSVTGELTASCTGTGLTQTTTIVFSKDGAGLGPTVQIYLSTFPFIPPSGYEGITPPEIGSLAPEELIPQYYWEVQSDGSLTVRYLGNLRDDITAYRSYMKVNACDMDGSTILSCDTEEIVSTQQDSAQTAEWSGNLPPPMAGKYKLSGEGTYAVLIANQFRGAPFVPLDGKELTGSTFYIEWDGRMFISGMTDPNNIHTPRGGMINFFEGCFTESFPFIDFGTCKDNFVAALAYLGFRVDNPFEGRFGEVTFGQCYTLTVLDDWLSLQNPVVCKQFPDYIRTTVTPFISFAIGLMAMRFIAQRRRDDL